MTPIKKKSKKKLSGGTPPQLNKMPPQPPRMPPPPPRIPPPPRQPPRQMLPQQFRQPSPQRQFQPPPQQMPQQQFQQMPQQQFQQMPQQQFQQMPQQQFQQMPQQQFQKIPQQQFQSSSPQTDGKLLFNLDTQELILLIAITIIPLFIYALIQYNFESLPNLISYLLDSGLFVILLFIVPVFIILNQQAGKAILGLSKIQWTLLLALLVAPIALYILTQDLIDEFPAFMVQIGSIITGIYYIAGIPLTVWLGPKIFASTPTGAAITLAADVM